MRKFRNIILEGFDGTGKSTLLPTLADYYSMETHWPGGPPKDFTDMLRILVFQLGCTNTIFDRVTSISEQCYRENMQYHTKKLLDGVIDVHIKNKDIIIFCTNIMVEDASGFQDKNHQEMIRRRSNIINTNYLVLFNEVPHIKYNTAIDNEHDIIKRINEYEFRSAYRK